MHEPYRGHRVLLFSQMTRMLDIIQDYLGYRGQWMYEYHQISLNILRMLSRILIHILRMLSRILILILCILSRILIRASGWLCTWRRKILSSEKLLQE